MAFLFETVVAWMDGPGSLEMESDWRGTGASRGCCPGASGGNQRAERLGARKPQRPRLLQGLERLHA